MTSTARPACQARTKRGAPCQAAAGPSGFCFTHDPALATERQAARRAGGHARHGRQLGTVPHEPIKIATVEDIMRLLEVAINDVLHLENSLGRARAIGYLASAALDALRVGKHEERLAALEQAYKERGNGRL